MQQNNIRFPLFIDIKNKNVLIVGGGNVATRRVKTLLQFDCNIKIVSLDVTEYLRNLARAGKITILIRNFKEEDLDDIFLATAATNVRFVNYSIGKLAREKSIYVSVADVKEESNFFFPAIAKFDNSIIAVGSNGENHHAVSNLANIIRDEDIKLTKEKYKPLKDINILVTSPQKSKSTIVSTLNELGAVVDHFPTIDILEINFDLPQLNEYTWIVFTSSAGVNIFFSKYKENGIDSRIFANNKFAVVGSQTAKTLNSYGIIADFIPKQFNGQSLMEELSINLTDKDNILLIRPQTNPEALRKVLQDKNIKFSELSIYETVYSNAHQGQVKDLKIYDYITFTSSSCVESFYNYIVRQNMENISNIKYAVCIGEKTANTAKKYNMNTITAKISTVDSLIEAIVENKKR